MPVSDEPAFASARHRGSRSRRRWMGWAAGLVLAWAALAVIDSVFILPSGATSASPPAHQRGTTTGSPQHHRARHQHRPPRSSSPRPSPTATALTASSVTAYGPRGAASGDNPGAASEVIDGSQQTAWHSDWYRSAAFGNLQSGTGLLIDMGKPVKVTRLTITMAAERGADLTVVAERVPGAPDGRGQASASDAGGTVRLTLARPRRERYLLVWFSLLPPDGAGTYEAVVYNVAIDGIR